jgi:Lrp/AsnC family leucine-responsive transcriptional regulator
MDRTDEKLLQILAKDSDISASALVSQLNLSIPAINKRISKLKASGVIRRSTVLTEPKAVGKPVLAYVLVVLDRFSHAQALFDYAEADRDVLECYAVTGEYDYIIKVCARDVQQLEEKLNHLKQNLGVSKSYTMLSLKEQKFCSCILPDTATNDSQEEGR